MFDRLVYPKSLLRELRVYQRRTKYCSSKHIPKFIFLCGERLQPDKITNRELVQRFYEGSSDVRLLFAEKLLKDLDIDLLSFEHVMAHISDSIFIFLESLGTATELGAFASVNTLLNKIIVYGEKDYQFAESFINKGPLEKIRRSGNEHNIIFGNRDSIYENAILWERLSSFKNRPKKCKINNEALRLDYCTYCYELLDLINLVGPVKRKELVSLYKYVKNFERFEFDFGDFGTIPNDSVFAIDFLIEAALIMRNENNYLRTCPSVRRNLLMFNMTDNQFNSFRSRFLARKFKYLDLKDLCFKELGIIC